MQTSKVWHCRLESCIWLQTTYLTHLECGKQVQESCYNLLGDAGLPTQSSSLALIPTALGGHWETGKGPEQGYPDAWGGLGCMSCVCRVRDRSRFSTAKMRGNLIAFNWRQANVAEPNSVWHGAMVMYQGMVWGLSLGYSAGIIPCPLCLKVLVCA